MSRFLTCCLCALLLHPSITAGNENPVLRIASFDVDVTPPLGSPVAYALVKSVVDPLRAKGIIVMPADQKPIVVCVFDWIGIANGGQDWWRKAIAESAETTPERVAVHTVHQHDGPRFDVTAIELFPQPDQAALHFDVEFAERARRSIQAAIQTGIEAAQPVTHVGSGKAKVSEVASNRRLLGPDGKVAKMRFSSCRDPESVAAPEGLIDPYVRLVSFWNRERPVVALAYYASHPMSHYGKGDVSCDFVGLAREARQQATGAIHIYFTGAGGNIAAGKYNDGSPEVRPLLAKRMSDAMRTAWKSTIKTAVVNGDVRWRRQEVALPVARHLDASQLRAILHDPATKDGDRMSAASNLAWVQRCAAGRKTELTCLQIGSVFLLHMPGELFVEYQLAAQRIRPNDFVCMAAYGDYGPGYIGTDIGYTQGGYETSPSASRVSRKVEQILTKAIQDLLQ